MLEGAGPMCGEPVAHPLVPRRDRFDRKEETRQDEPEPDHRGHERHVPREGRSEEREYGTLGPEPLGEPGRGISAPGFE